MVIEKRLIDDWLTVLTKDDRHRPVATGVGGRRIGRRFCISGEDDVRRSRVDVPAFDVLGRLHICWRRVELRATIHLHAEVEDQARVRAAGVGPETCVKGRSAAVRQVGPSASGERSKNKEVDAAIVSLQDRVVL